jgi:hypothetical protein
MRGRYRIDIKEDKNQGPEGPAVTWDDAGLNTLYGAVFTVKGTREEISLLFAGRSVRTGNREETVKVSDRIILIPFTAKRLIVLLRKIMARHELRFGAGSSEPRAFIETSN